MTESSNIQSGSPHPPDWSQSDSLLQQEIRAEMRRIVTDEQWIAQTERRARIDWWMALGALLLGVLAISAIVLSVKAMNRNIDTVARAAPKDNSVGPSAIRDGAVGAAKLAPGAVGTAVLVDRSVTAGKLAPGAVGAAALGAKIVTAAAVADDTLTGAQINEGTLGRVRGATNAARLGGLSADAFLTGVTIVTSQTETSSTPRKGPIVAVCPSGSRVIGGGAEIVGATNIALIQSLPSGTGAWTATARRQTAVSLTEWKLVVKAICGTWGKS